MALFSDNVAHKSWQIIYSKPQCMLFQIKILRISLYIFNPFKELKLIN